MEGLPPRPSGELQLSELEYLQQYEEEFIQPPSAAQSLGASDCGPSVSFPPPAPPAANFPQPPPILITPADVSTQEEQLLKEWETLQKIRTAAANEAQRARHHADNVARLQAAIISSQEKEANNLISTSANEFAEERIVVWPPETRCVPADYDVTHHNAAVLQARAQRVLELGNFYFSRNTTQRISSEQDAEEAIRQTAEKAGGYQNFAKTLRGRIKIQQEQQHQHQHRRE